MAIGTHFFQSATAAPLNGDLIANSTTSLVKKSDSLNPYDYLHAVIEQEDHDYTMNLGEAI